MNKQYKRSLVTLAWLLVAAPSVALASGLEQFKSFVASSKAAKGEFSQTLLKTADGKLPKGKSSSGSFVFARPGKFVWIYSKPYEQVLQSDGEKLYVYDKDLNQVTVKKLGDVLAGSPAAILFGSNEIEKNFNLKEAGTKDELEWLELTPKQADNSFQMIAIGLKNGLPQAMQLRDSFGQTSSLTFSKFEKNPALAADQFKFVMPKGVDVFNQ